MKRKFAAKFLAVLMTAAFVLTGCGSDASSTATEGTAQATEGAESTDAASGGVVTLARNLDSGNLDPVMTADNCDIWVLNMMVEGLVTSSDDGQEIIPAVADSWTVSENELTYTFHLRDGIKFSNGDDVTIDDCIYSLTRAKDADGPWLGMLDMIDIMEDG